jgi:AraC family ethanolamine operon transcriptional activator
MADSSIIRISPRQLPRLWIVLNGIFKRIAIEPGILKSVSVRHHIEEAVYEVLADALYESVDTRAPRTIYSVRRRIVWDAIEYVRSDPYGNVSVGDLCRLLHLNRRTQQDYFQDVVKLSPKQYLLAYRLSKVRSLIIDSNGSTSVRDAAMRWGFWHLGDFANLYRRLFQELPSCTAESRRSLCK